MQPNMKETVLTSGEDSEECNSVSQFELDRWDEDGGYIPTEESNKIRWNHKQEYGGESR